ncbi:hypothetical protein QLV94_08855, partial [Streptococcus equi subsp. zooepidemicus]|uniref:hypothetical protein n=1 Tax=Streptococcus equi TaxID=1336 RepID=UPI0024A9BFD1
RKQSARPSELPVALPCLVFQACFLLLLLVLENVHIFIVADIKAFSILPLVLETTFIFSPISVIFENVFRKSN